MMLPSSMGLGSNLILQGYGGIGVIDTPTIRPLFTDCELASMRAAVEKTFTQTIALQRQVVTVDALGGNTPVWVTVEIVAGRVVTPKVGQKLIADAFREVDVFEVRLPYNTTVLKSYRVIVDDTDIYSVEGSDTGRADALQLTVMVRRVR
jgi:SPP1 family predicted phage head-tail adaptor